MRAYKVVDVFTAKPLSGNPVAVVLDSEGLDDNQMQAIAGWTNLSETTFVLPPTTPRADYRLRIFTPLKELQFAGHPTIGSAHAALETGRINWRSGGLVQECVAGLVRVSLEENDSGKALLLTLPTARVQPLTLDDINELESALGTQAVLETPPVLVNVGSTWIVAKLSAASEVLEVRPNFALSASLERRLGATGVTIFGSYQSGNAAMEVRSFTPSCGVNEDPVCGSGNGGVGVFQYHYHLLPEGDVRYVASQGRCVGRDGQVVVSISVGGAVAIGGKCITCVDGMLSVD